MHFLMQPVQYLFQKVLLIPSLLIPPIYVNVMNVHVVEVVLFHVSNWAMCCKKYGILIGSEASRWEVCAN